MIEEGKDKKINKILDYKLIKEIKK